MIIRNFMLLLTVIVISGSSLQAMMPEDIQQEYDRNVKMRQMVINMIKSIARDITTVLNTYDETFYTTRDLRNQISSLEIFEGSLSQIHTRVMNLLFTHQYGQILTTESATIKDHLIQLNKIIDLILQRLRPLSTDKRFSSNSLTHQIQIWQNVQNKIRKIAATSISEKEVEEES